jgi:hypothetical protein
MPPNRVSTANGCCIGAGYRETVGRTQAEQGEILMPKNEEKRAAEEAAKKQAVLCSPADRSWHIVGILLACLYEL